MQHYETHQQLERAAYDRTMAGFPCHLEWRNGSPVLVAKDTIIGRIAND